MYDNEKIEDESGQKINNNNKYIEIVREQPIGCAENIFFFFLL